MPTAQEIQEDNAARNFTAVRGATNWLKPDAPDSTGDYWVDTKKGEKALRPWDQIALGGTYLPGLWSVEPSTSISFQPNNILKDPGSVSRGIGPTFRTVLTPKGYNPATVNATGEIWTAADWEDLRQIISQISPKKTNDTAPRAFSIDHPACALLGIDQVIITSVSVPKITNQTMMVRLSMLQYFPQGPVLFSPYGNSGPAQLPPLQVPNANNNVSSGK